MKKERITLPRQKSLYLQVQCQECGNKQIVYSHTTSEVKCKICGTLIAKNTGGKAIIYSSIVRRFD
ncbi:MAG: 30S ribosomal protein S27e [Nitrososphaerales archaeon]